MTVNAHTIESNYIKRTNPVLPHLNQISPSSYQAAIEEFTPQPNATTILTPPLLVALSLTQRQETPPSGQRHHALLYVSNVLIKPACTCTDINSHCSYEALFFSLDHTLKKQKWASTVCRHKRSLCFTQVKSTATFMENRHIYMPICLYIERERRQHLQRRACFSQR